MFPLLLRCTSQTYIYPASGSSPVRPHAVTSLSSGATFGYDAAGNMTSANWLATGTGRPNQSLTYDGENRLTGVAWTDAQSVSHTVSYFYDGDGGLARKLVDGAETRYLGGGTYEHNLATGEVTKYYTLGGKRVAMRKVGGSNPGLTYLLTDHLSSTSVQVDAAGNLLGRIVYDAWGSMRSSSGALSTDRRYTGQRAEESTGLYHYSDWTSAGRFYDPALGRFVQADKIVADPSNPQDLGRYTYVLNNPIRYTDPTGQCAPPVTAICIAAGVGAGAAGDALTVAFGAAYLLWRSMNGGSTTATSAAEPSNGATMEVPREAASARRWPSRAGGAERMTSVRATAGRACMSSPKLYGSIP